MVRGWVKIERSIMQHWIWTDANYFKAWATIVMRANYETKMVMIDNELIECKRGQVLYSFQSWAKLFGKDWSIQKVRTFFKLLEKDGMIVTEGLRKTTRLTICKYDLYQEKQHTDNKQITTTKERKENFEGVVPVSMQHIKDLI
jgi:phage terminase large subunit-like protein